MNKTILNKIDTLIEEFNARNLIPGYQGYQEGKKTNNQLLGMILGPEGVKGANENSKLKDAYTKSNILRNVGGGILAGGAGPIVLHKEKLVRELASLSDEEKIMLEKISNSGGERAESANEVIDAFNSPYEAAFGEAMDNPLPNAIGALSGAALVAGASPAINYGLGKLSGAIKNKLTNQKK